MKLHGHALVMPPQGEMLASNIWALKVNRGEVQRRDKMSFSLEKIKEFEREIERRQGVEKVKEREKKKAEEEKRKKQERAKLHAEWRKKGVVYYRSMLKKEKAEEQMRILHEKRLAEEKAKEEAAKARNRLKGRNGEGYVKRPPAKRLTVNARLSGTTTAVSTTGNFLKIKS